MTVVTVEVEEVLRSFTDTKVEIQVKVTEKLLLSVLFETEETILFQWPEQKQEFNSWSKKSVDRCQTLDGNRINHVSESAPVGIKFEFVIF